MRRHATSGRLHPLTSANQASGHYQPCDRAFKTNEDRLLLVGPEMASVLATIITRLRADNCSTVLLTNHYDPYE